MLVLLLTWARSSGYHLGGSLPRVGGAVARCTCRAPHAVAIVTPIGPFCPFRSSTCALDGAVDRSMGDLSAKAPQFAAEMARMQLDIQTGKLPEPSRVGSLAADMEGAFGQWRSLLTRLQIADDFQSREFFKMTQAHLEAQGQSIDQIGALMKWQIDSMRAFGAGTMPPMPPAGVDFAELERQAQQGGGGGLGGMVSPTTMSAPPFTGTEPAFESRIVQEEYAALVRDHEKIIQMGERYGTFDPLGKLAFLDALEAIEERWDVFFSRFSLMGDLSPEFKQQSEAFLRQMGLSGSGFRELLRAAHTLMRADAERERASATG